MLKWVRVRGEGRVGNDLMGKEKRVRRFSTKKERRESTLREVNGMR